MTPNLVRFARRVAAQIPGTEANGRARIAIEKRTLEKSLRADGWSRSAAKVEAAKRVGSRGD